MEELKEYFNTKIKRVYDVYEIFKEFFGEDRVDLQNVPQFENLHQHSSKLEISRSLSEIEKSSNAYNILPFILIYYDKVTIKNEFDASRELTKLYVKVTIDFEGRIFGKFSMNRAEYTYKEYISNYMHSHISCIPLGNLRQFQSPCTGNGPINRTICSLAREYNEDIWRLFCVEVDKFVTVESIAGTPYHKLEQVGMSSSSNSYYTDYTNVDSTDIAQICLFKHITQHGQEAINSFIEYLIKNAGLKYKYSNGYYIAGTPKEIHLKISNNFIKWFNVKKAEKSPMLDFGLPDLLAHGILVKAIYEDGHFKIMRGSQRCTTNVSAYEGRDVCTFKGNNITVHFINDINTSESLEDSIYLLSNRFTGAIVRLLQNVLNYAYGNNEFEREESGDTRINKENIHII